MEKKLNKLRRIRKYAQIKPVIKEIQIKVTKKDYFIHFRLAKRKVK